jgi:hypothetical protein
VVLGAAEHHDFGRGTTIGVRRATSTHLLCAELQRSHVIALTLDARAFFLRARGTPLSCHASKIFTESRQDDIARKKNHD